MWRRVFANVSFSDFYVMDGVPYSSNAGFPSTLPTFTNKLTFDAFSNNSFGVSRILFASGNLTDLIVFQTDQTIRQMTAYAIGNCTLNYTYKAPDSSKCIPRYYPLATNPAVQGAVGQPVSVITGNDISNIPFKRRALGYH